MPDALSTRPRLLALVFGLLMGLGQAPLSLWWLALPACGGVLWSLTRAMSARHAAILGWCAGAGYIAATHFWIVDPFFVEPWKHGWMAPFAVLGLSGGIALIWAAGAALAYGVGAGRMGRTLALIPALTLAELARAYILTGFPWAPVGALWIETPVAQLASLLGVHGLTCLTLAVFCVPLALRRPARWGGVLASFAAVGTIWFWGAQRLGHDIGRDDAIVRIVQPNAPQHLKWHPEHIPIFFNRALNLTRAPAEQAPDLILWPETSVPALIEHADNLMVAMKEAAGDAPVIFGIQRRNGAAYHNSMGVIGVGDEPQVYDKRHLVPFGEYVPMAGVLSLFGISHFGASQGYGYAPGKDTQPLLDLGALGRALPLICYEGIFPHDLRGFDNRADLIVLITNDAWFGKMTMPYGHLDHARMRAIEVGLPMIRAANTGISAVIDARGRVTAQLALGQTGYLDASIPLPLPKTQYARTGDRPTLSVALALLLLCAAGRLPARGRVKD